MRVITVRQPWAWAIAHGGKHVENRSTGAAGWRYRGPLAIHAAAGWSQRGAADARVRRAWERRTGLDAIDTPERVGGLLVHRSVADPDPRSRIHFGAVIAVAELVDVHPDSTFGCCRPWGESTYPNTGTPGVVQQVTHLVLEDVRPLADDGYPARGRLGLWVPDDDLADELAEGERGTLDVSRSTPSEPSREGDGATSLGRALTDGHGPSRECSNGPDFASGGER